MKGKTDEAWMRNLVPFAVVGSNYENEYKVPFLSMQRNQQKRSVRQT